MAEERFGVGLAEPREGYRVATGSNLGHCRICRCDLATFGTLVRCMVCGLPQPDHPETKKMEKLVEEKKKAAPRPTVSMMTPPGAEFYPAGLPAPSGPVKDELACEIPTVEGGKLPAMMRVQGQSEPAKGKKK